MSFGKLKKGLNTIEMLERELHLKQLQINRLLNITQAINNNVKTTGLFEMYSSFLSWEMGVKKTETKYYKEMMKRLKIDNPKRILFWDNEKENVNKARELGIRAYIYGNYEQFREKTNKIMAS